MVSLDGRETLVLYYNPEKLWIHTALEISKIKFEKEI